MDQIYKFSADEDVYNRDAYNYLLQHQQLKRQLQSLKEESLGLRKMREMFEHYEKEYAESTITTNNTIVF